MVVCRVPTVGAVINRPKVGAIINRPKVGAIINRPQKALRQEKQAGD